MYPETWRSIIFYIITIGIISYSARHFPNNFLIKGVKKYAGWILGLCLIAIIFTATGSVFKRPLQALDMPLLLFILVFGYLLIKSHNVKKK